ncbi:hypothetical protein [Alistipes finegoldii]|jgi:hypothetical protein|uniref:hypothetical protein n=1 Tax=Alistipes finegoldii TaxID=214856 RepID=UPI002598FFFB|nr:hypothetical protein [Alistipes finegoldii]
MKAQVGNFYYGRHHNIYGVWQYEVVNEAGSSARFVKDFIFREDARAFVWRMNDWGTPTK